MKKIYLLFVFFMPVLSLIASNAQAEDKSLPENTDSKSEPFINVSYHLYDASVRDADLTAVIDDRQGQDLSLVAGFRNLYGRYQIGTAVEYTRIFTTDMLALRAIDAAYVISPKWSAGAFIGAASLDSGLPQNGYYVGLSLSALNIWQGLDGTFELRYGNGLGRDRRLASDVNDPTLRPDLFVDVVLFAVGITKRF